MDKIRHFILEEAARQGVSLAEWSKAIGKNHAYLQQFIHRGVPARLPEGARMKLAVEMKVPESLLGAPTANRSPFASRNYDGPVDEEDAPDEVGIQEIDVRAGLGGGGTVDQTLAWRHGDAVDPVKEDTWKFPAPFIRNELRRSEDRIKIIETFGDSMSPTIQSGDRVIIDTDHTIPSPDGLYAVRDRYGSIVIKRLQSLRRGDPPIIRIISDNKAHDPEDVGADEIAIIGRVLWGLKRL